MIGKDVYWTKVDSRILILTYPHNQRLIDYPTRMSRRKNGGLLVEDNEGRMYDFAPGWDWMEWL